MKIALRTARRGIRKGQSPFGACIVRKGKRISSCHNQVWKNGDSTAHAEVMAIREACKKLKTIDLSDCVIYSTCEPCPMCFSACHWSRIKKILYGVRIEEAEKVGFHELRISNKKMNRMGKGTLQVEGGILQEECWKMMKEWADRKDHKVY